MRLARCHNCSFRYPIILVLILAYFKNEFHMKLKSVLNELRYDSITSQTLLVSEVHWAADYRKATSF